jgi:ATP-dependent DNA ligase
MRWLRDTKTGTDGVVAKRMNVPYRPGEHIMVKVKRIRTADHVVGGFRYGNGTTFSRSLLLGLYDHAGLLHHVGFTSSIARKDRATLTRNLRRTTHLPALPEVHRENEAAGRPNGPRTRSLRADLIVEMQYDHITDGRFRHGTKLLR